MKPHRLPTLVLAWAALASCAQTPPPAPASAPETESARLARELNTLIGPAACSTDSQCRTLAVGARACGGPATYLAWSTVGTDAQRLTELAARQAAAERRENFVSGGQSICSMAVDPGASCQAGHCQLVNPSSAARPAKAA